MVTDSIASVCLKISADPDHGISEEIDFGTAIETVVLRQSCRSRSVAEHRSTECKGDYTEQGYVKISELNHHRSGLINVSLSYEAKSTPKNGSRRCL